MLYLLLLMLSACNPFASFKSTTDDILSANWAPNDKTPIVNRVYCYQTLGDPVCYAKPLRGKEQQERLIAAITNSDKITTTTE